MLNSLRVDQSAATRSKRQQLDHLLIVSAPNEIAVLVGVVLLMLALLAWLLFARIENGYSAGCVLIEPGLRHDVVSSEPGHLLEYLVGTGERVEPGAPIARQSVPELAREISALRDRIDALERDALQTGASGGSSPILVSARVALLEMEALRSVRETIVTQGGGEVEALQSALGDYLSTGAPIARIRGISGNEERPVSAVLMVDQSIAGRLEPGQSASAEVSATGGRLLSLPGELVSVSGGHLPGWLAESLPPGDGETHQVRVALETPPNLSIADVTDCRVRIVLGRVPPVALLFPGRS